MFLISDPSATIRRLLIEEIEHDCGCTCCADAEERVRCNRVIIDACDCNFSPEKEHKVE